MAQFVSCVEATTAGRFNALHSRKQDNEVQLYAFDIMALDGEDLRQLPLSLRKTNLARLLARRPDGIFVAPYEQGEISPDLFRAACTRSRRPGVETTRSALSRRSFAGLDQGQEPEASRDGARDGSHPIECPDLPPQEYPRC
jgi:hypothetical protein